MELSWIESASAIAIGLLTGNVLTEVFASIVRYIYFRIAVFRNPTYMNHQDLPPGAGIDFNAYLQELAKEQKLVQEGLGKNVGVGQYL